MSPAHLHAVPAAPRGPLTADGLEVGHRYAYVAPGRAGLVYVAPSGALTRKPEGIEADWAERNRARLTFTHATTNCRGCKRQTERTDQR